LGMLQHISAKEIAFMGLRVQRDRLTVIANNIANSQTTRMPDGSGAFRRQMVLVRGEALKPTVNPSKYGVKVKRVMNDPTPLRVVYDPGHPDANTEGYVSYPNVDVSMEMVDMIAAQRAYDANLAVVASDRRMNQKALELIQG